LILHRKIISKTGEVYLNSLTYILLNHFLLKFCALHKISVDKFGGPLTIGLQVPFALFQSQMTNVSIWSVNLPVGLHFKMAAAAQDNALGRSRDPKREIIHPIKQKNAGRNTL
jgi:hypothetical protein